MNKQLSVVAIGVAAFLVLSTLTASSLIGTPLYTVRMEQASSKMSFLPTDVNGFTYSTENGYTLNYDAAGYCGGTLLEITVGKTCDGTCVIDPTCPQTCRYTCDDPTCGNTCPDTCPLTCDTCDHTCGLCTYDTCFISCVGFCQPTGEPGCW